jgi:hypothetical protein
MKNRFFETLKDNRFLPYTIEMEGNGLGIIGFTIVGKKGRFEDGYYTIYRVTADLDGNVLSESVIKSSRKISDISDRTKDMFYTNGYSAMSGNIEVIRSYVGGELRVLQGMDRMKTIEKANIDCPYIITFNEWNINNVPKIFSN